MTTLNLILECCVVIFSNWILILPKLPYEWSAISCFFLIIPTLFKYQLQNIVTHSFHQSSIISMDLSKSIFQILKYIFLLISAFSFTDNIMLLIINNYLFPAVNHPFKVIWRYINIRFFYILYHLLGYFIIFFLKSPVLFNCALNFIVDCFTIL